MAQESVFKIEKALLGTLNEIDKLYTRKIQRDMHICAANCCDRSSETMETVYDCVKLCSSDFEKAHRYILAEFNQFQNRLQRCVLQCSDESADKLGITPSSSQIAQFNRDYEKCVISCANRHLDMIPVFFKRLKELLSQKAYSTIDIEDDPKVFKLPTLL